MTDLASREELAGEEVPATNTLVLTKLRQFLFPHASHISRICVSPDSQVLAVTLRLDETGEIKLFLLCLPPPKPPSLACDTPGPDPSRMESLAVCSSSCHFWLTPSAPSSWCRGRNILVVLTAEEADSSILWIDVSSSEHGLTLLTLSSLSLFELSSLLKQDHRASSILATQPLPEDQQLSFRLMDCKHDDVLIVAEPCFLFLLSLSSDQKTDEESLSTHSQRSPLLSALLPLYPRDDRTPPIASPLDSIHFNPREIGTLTGVNIRGPILLSLYSSGRIFLHHLPSGGNLGILSVPSYLHHTLTEETDAGAVTCLSPPYLCFSTHPHLEYLAVANRDNYVIVLYLRRYLALFPAHVNLGVVGVPTSGRVGKPDSLTPRLQPDQEELLLKTSQARSSRLSADSPLWKRRLRLMRERQTSPQAPLPPPPIDPASLPSEGIFSSTTSSRHSPLDSISSSHPARETPVPPSEPQILDNPFSSHFTHEIPSTPSHGCVWFSSPTATEQLQTSVISCHSNSLTLFYSPPDSPDAIAHVAHVSLQTGERLSHPLAPPCLPIHTHSHASDRLLLLLQGGWVVCPVVGQSRQSLLGGILAHCDASAAELLCQHNGWQQSLLPVSVLRESLAHRQLDSVCFYLRMRRTREGELELVGGTGGEETNGLPMPHASIKQSIDTLYGTLRGSFKDSYEAQFSSQILNLSHKFLLFLLVRFSATSHPDTEGEGEISDEFIASQLSIFRQFMSVDNVTPGSTERVDSITDREFAEAESGEGMEASTPAEWRHMRRSDIIRDGLDRQNLPLAQTYLHSRLEEQVRSQGGPENATSPLDLRHRSSEISWHGIRRLVLHLAYQCLEREDLSKCEQRLAIVGPCVPQMLRYIATHTCSRFARSVLFSELKVRGELKREETDLLEYLQILEHTYPSASYKQSLAHAQKISSKLRPSSLPEYPPFRETPPPSLLTELWRTGELEEKCAESFGADKPLLSSSASAGKRDAYYFAGAYSWVQGASPRTRDLLLMEGFLLKEEHHSQQCRQLLPPNTLLLLYATSQLGLRAARHVSRLGKDAQVRESLAGSVTAVLEETERATNFTRRLLTSALTEVGVAPSPPTNPGLLLIRVLQEVSESHLLLSRAPSLSGAAGRLDEFLLQLSRYSAGEGCASFLSLCLEDLTATYDIPINRLLSLASQRGEDELDTAPVWIEMLVISQHLYSPHSKDMPFKEAMFRYSIANARYILEQPNIRLADTFQFSKALIPLATLIYSPVPLEQTVGGSDDYSVPRETFIQAVQPYPKLLGALFPSGERAGAIFSAPLQEVTVYELLQGSVPFNMQQLFAWQSTNRLSEKPSELEHSRTPLSSALHKDFPHFSSVQLSQRYGYPQRLDYVHYLNKGNPAFAYANLLASDHKIESKYCSKRMKAVCQRVYRLGLSQFSTPKVTASCAALMEMLGWDSAPFRTDIVLLNLLIEYQGHTDQVKQHALSLQEGLSQQQETAGAHSGISLIPLQAEEVFKGLLEAGELAVDNFAAAEVWAVLETFCQYHALPPTRGYLEKCATANLWPQLLSYAQMWSCPPKLLLEVIREHFLDSDTREHLETGILVMLDKSGPRERSKKKSSHPHKQSSRNNGSAQKRESAGDSQAVRKISLNKETAGTGVPANLQGNSVPPEVFDLLPLDRSSGRDRSNDLFELICASQICSYPAARTLLAFGISLRRNILPIMATCFLPQEPDILYEEAEAGDQPPTPSQRQAGTILDCLCVWIFCKLSTTRELCTAIHSLGIVPTPPMSPLHQSPLLQWHQWELKDLERVCVCLSADMPSYGIILKQAFHFFDHENPFFFFLRFVETYALHSFEQSQRQLEGFLVSMKKLCSGEQQYPKTSLGSPKWVSDLTSLCLLQMLAHPITPFHHISLLTTVIKAMERVPQPYKLPKDATYDPSQSDSFTGYPIPLANLLDTQTLSQLLSVLQRMERVPVEITSRCTLPLIPDVPTSPWFNTLSRPLPTALPPEELISQLADLDLAEVVQQVCAIVHVYPTKAVLRSFQLRYRRLAKSSWWLRLPNRLSFWQQCSAALQNTTGDIHLVAEFFELIASRCQLEGGEGEGSISMFSDTILLRQLALDWHLKCPTQDPGKVSELKKQIWLSRLEWINSSGDPKLCLGDVLSLQSEDCDAIGFYDLSQLCLTQPTDSLLAPTESELLSQARKDALSITLGFLLDSNLVHLALELADLFKHRPPNLAIVCTCIALAQRLIELKDIHPTILSILNSAEVGSDSAQLAPDLQLIHYIQLFRVRLEQTDSPSLTGGSRCLERIQSLVQLSQGLVMSYQVTANESTRTCLLTILTSEELGQKFQLALPFVRSCCVDPSKLSHFLERCVYITLCRHFGHSYEEEVDDPVMVRPVFDVDCKSEQFSELSRVCDEAELGRLLLQHASKDVQIAQVSKSQPKLALLQVTVELLIRAETCLSNACQLDQISGLINSTLTLAKLLTLRQSWSLLARLLTGIGRFHELSAILEIFVNHEQLEYLLKKGLEKEELLKTALLKFLVKHHENDIDKLTIVAMRFNLYRGLGETCVKQAKIMLRKLSRDYPKLEDFPDVQERVREACKLFCNAATYYSRDECYLQSAECKQQARLMCVQCRLLPFNIAVINISKSMVRTILASPNKNVSFSEALIIVEAYSLNSAKAWGDVLHGRCVCHKNNTFINSYISKLPFNPDVYKHLVNRFTTENIKNADSRENLLYILNTIPDIVVKETLLRELSGPPIRHKLQPALSEEIVSELQNL